VAYRRDAFERAGGFDEDDPLLHPASGRAFGEDAMLGVTVLAHGGRRAFAEDALVYHRCVAMTFKQWLADRRQLQLFPGLARRVRLSDLFYWGVFLNRASAFFDFALYGLVCLLVFQRPIFAIALLPWLFLRGRMTYWYAGMTLARWPRFLAKFAVSDAVTFASLLKGSVRYRRVLL
jgi:hypothetical protein